MEERFEVVPVGIRYVCDDCGKGEMLPNGNNDFSTDIPIFEHECNQCGIKKKFNEKYPLIRYEFKQKI